MSKELDRSKSGMEGTEWNGKGSTAVVIQLCYLN